METEFYRYQSKFPQELMEIAIDEYEYAKQESITLLTEANEQDMFLQWNEWDWLADVTNHHVNETKINIQAYYDEAAASCLSLDEFSSENEKLYVYEEYCKFLFPNYHYKFMVIYK